MIPLAKYAWTNVHTRKILQRANFFEPTYDDMENWKAIRDYLYTKHANLRFGPGNQGKQRLKAAQLQTKNILAFRHTNAHNDLHEINTHERSGHLLQVMLDIKSWTNTFFSDQDDVDAVQVEVDGMILRHSL